MELFLVLFGKVSHVRRVAETGAAMVWVAVAWVAVAYAPPSGWGLWTT